MRLINKSLTESIYSTLKEDTIDVKSRVMEMFNTYGLDELSVEEVLNEFIEGLDTDEKVIKVFKELENKGKVSFNKDNMMATKQKNTNESDSLDDILDDYYDIDKNNVSDPNYTELINSFIKDHPEYKGKEDELKTKLRKIDEDTFNQAMKLFGGKEGYIKEFGQEAYDNWLTRLEINESVMINTGSTTVTSDETGVTIEDNGNVITSGNGTTINIDNEADVLPDEMDVAEEIPIEEPVEEIPEELVDEVPEEDIENEEPVEVPEEDIETEEISEEELEESATEEYMGTKELARQAFMSLQKDNNGDYLVMNDGNVIETLPASSDEEAISQFNEKYQKLEDCDEKPMTEADGYNQNQNVEIYQNPEFDYQILDITELDNIDTGDIRAIDMANILNDLDESLTEAFGTPNWGEINSFLTRKGTHKKTNESYSSAILELTLPRLNESVGEYKNVYMLEVYGDKALKECIVRNSKSQIIKEYSGKSKNPVKHFEGVILDIINSRKLNEDIYYDENGTAHEENIICAGCGREFTEDEFYMLTTPDSDPYNAYCPECCEKFGIDDGMNESIEYMVNEPMKDKGVNFADSKAITKDEERQEKHIKQHDNGTKENKQFKIDKVDQDNTTGNKEEDITDTVEVEDIKKPKKEKVDAEKIKESVLTEREWKATYTKGSELRRAIEECSDDEESLRNFLEVLKNACSDCIELCKEHNNDEYFINGFQSVIDDIDMIKDDEEELTEGQVEYELEGFWDWCDAADIFVGLSESAKLNEAEDELLDEPIVTDGTDLEAEDELNAEDELEESGSEVAIFHRKPASVDAMRAAEQNGITVNKSNYKVVGTKELSSDEFNDFASNLTSKDYEWLSEYNDTGFSGEFKCVEVVNTDDSSFTILVDPEGYKYARYAAIKENPEGHQEEGLLDDEPEVNEEPTETSEEVIEDEE